MVGVRRHGFTLVETLIALVLSSFVIMLVSNAFLQQNRFYSTQTLRTGVQDNVRAATELMAREVRNTAEDGVVQAQALAFTVRSPMAVAVVCNRANASNADIMTDGGESGLQAAAIAGLAVRGGGTWDYQNATWASLDGSDGLSAAACAANGADTVGALADFHRISGADTYFSGGLDAGDVVMLFRETTFSIQTSQLDSTGLGLFRTELGGSAVEFATGIDSTAGFHYRVQGSTSWSSTISGGSLADVEFVRISADGRRPAPTGGVDDITFGWTVDVPLRNIR
jgi:prepilin-type N-terminal cleavage/methylation domain-containing protein